MKKKELLKNLKELDKQIEDEIDEVTESDWIDYDELLESDFIDYNENNTYLKNLYILKIMINLVILEIQIFYGITGDKDEQQ